LVAGCNLDPAVACQQLLFGFGVNLLEDAKRLCHGGCAGLDPGGLTFEEFTAWAVAVSALTAGC
jgi:hypothetical protein